jgi:hypothetical protein
MKYSKHFEQWAQIAHTVAYNVSITTKKVWCQKVKTMKIVCRVQG